MSEAARGRTAPTPPPSFPGKAPEPAGAYAWNAARDSAQFEVDRAPGVIRYRHEGKSRSVDVFDLFGQRSVRDPEERLLRRRLESLPQYIRRYYAQRLTEIQEQQGNKKAAEWLKGSFGRFVLPRVDSVNEQYQPDSNMPAVLMVFRDDFHRIPWAGKRELKKLSYRLADALTNELMRETNYQMEQTGDAEFSIISGYGRAGWLITHLNMTAPGWQRYCAEELTAEEALCSAARIESPSWWMRRLRKMHDQWREHLMIASGYVHKKAAPYCSDPALNEWVAQKRANREFINSRDLEDQATGERSSLAEKVNGSVANPAVRRAELMNRMRGFEDMAKADGLAGDFYTLTAPSKYHSMQMSGKRNNKYKSASPRDTQRYLCNVWSKVRAAWARKGIRAFGFRVTEPHHDGTPHWHLLLFFQPDRIAEARAIFREYALVEDGHEKGAKEARFTVVPMDEQFGSATGYIAKYISKNIDGHGMDGETDDETGEDIRDMAKRVCAWASRWRIRQFQQIGGAPVTVYRELGRLRDRELVLHPEIKPAQEAAGAYDWPGYTMAQGGPLVSREDLRVRLNYETTENGNDYGDHVSRVSGVYSPFAPLHIIYTRTTEYKIVAKLKTGTDEAFDVSGGIAAPRSSVNNCTREPIQEEKSPISKAVIHDSVGDSALVNAPVSEVVAINFEKLSRKERRDLNRRLLSEVREERNADRERRAAPIRQAKTDPRVQQLGDFAKSVGMDMSDSQLRLMLGGAEMRIDGYIVSATNQGELKRRKDDTAGVKAAGIWKHMKSQHGIDSDGIRNDPVGSYAQMLKQVDPCAWDRLFGDGAKK
ncbi:replication endonuclease [Candidatus Pantoea floridensis]|uniref:Bacteriophage replication gene A protein (GPA) n=1 Tax=Candidatus Pantoea floridensis TaxID=1938870 RepID=A0A286BTV6_9GAMM|nr:replication endonuclease [Pantoea floridensis]PIF24136.1 bacteriophage replication gene A protein [Enterobacteriaceae bacterium JKS000233]SOD37589.1 Bacteriophage replication gene A protein (GPA) [Pantoea floridensis]